MNPWESPGVPLPEVASAVSGGVADGLTDEQIAVNVGVSVRQVQRLRQAIRALRTPEAPGLLDAELRRLHAAEFTTAEIAADMGTTAATIRDRLRRLGLEPHKSPRPSRSEGRTEYVGFAATREEVALLDGMRQPGETRSTVLRRLAFRPAGGDG